MLGELGEYPLVGVIQAVHGISALSRATNCCDPMLGARVRGSVRNMWRLIAKSPANII
jgi:hypothetical protein